VHNSLQYLDDQDTRAMAVYLKGIAESSSKPAASALPSAESSLLVSLGKTVYEMRCATCHGAQGEGKPPHWPPLAGNQSISMESAVNPIRMVLNGGYPPQTAGNPRPYGMPPFAQVMSDEDIAAVVTYVRVSWGNHGQPVTALEVNALRSAPLLD
jgi:mono/diheme cytochrome c family protein